MSSLSGYFEPTAHRLDSFLDCAGVCAQIQEAADDHVPRGAGGGIEEEDSHVDRPGTCAVKYELVCELPDKLNFS